MQVAKVVKSAVFRSAVRYPSKETAVCGILKRTEGIWAILPA
jgi:hypothetical protein